MRKIYIDVSSLPCCGAWGVICRDAPVVPAGTTVYAMPVSDKNAEYERWAAEYDIHFIFDDIVPNVDFYAVPMFDVLATDSADGYIGTIGQTSDLQGNAPLGYIDSERNIFLIAPNGTEFMRRASEWRHHLVPYEGLKLYASKGEAEGELEFLDPSRLPDG